MNRVWSLNLGNNWYAYILFLLCICPWGYNLFCVVLIIGNTLVFCLLLIYIFGPGIRKYQHLLRKTVFINKFLTSFLEQHFVIKIKIIFFVPLWSTCNYGNKGSGQVWTIKSYQSNCIWCTMEVVQTETAPGFNICWKKLSVQFITTDFKYFIMLTICWIKSTAHLDQSVLEHLKKY